MRATRTSFRDAPKAQTRKLEVVARDPGFARYVSAPE